MAESETVERDRRLLAEAQQRGALAQLGVFIRLSGPGWLQSAITLGGGSLSGALFLGILGGHNLLWLQLVAIIMGVIMLSAISYVTLSTGKRPFRLITHHVNPVLGWGWIIGTVMANMIWCMPQFSLCYEALEKNLVGVEALRTLDRTISPAPAAMADGDSEPDVMHPITRNTKILVSLVLLAAATTAVIMNQRGGRAMKLFDAFLKVLVGIVVVCFVGVVILLTTRGQLDWNAILGGFRPDIGSWNRPTGRLAELIAGLSESARDFWSTRLVSQQRDVMMAAAATAVGINMTFLMPYSLLKRGWGRTFRGLARFDLCTGMAIPYVLVTSCVVIAAGARFHAEADENFLSSDPAEIQNSPLFRGARPILGARLADQLGDADLTAPPGTAAWDDASQRIAEATATLPDAERRLAASLVKRSGFDLASAIAPLLGAETARIAFGLGIFGMGFSSIIILMLINGFAFCELANRPNHAGISALGCLVAGAIGAMWPFVWQGETQFYLAIVASTFAGLLLPIAYFTFFLMLNSRAVMGEERPRGLRRLVWNLLMAVSVAGATAASWSAIEGKVTAPGAGTTGTVIMYAAIGFLVFAAAGFFMRRPSTPAD